MTIYFVRRSDGTFRAKGSYAYWTDDMQEARAYSRIGPAKALVTRWQRENPDEPTLTLLAFTLNVEDALVVDLSEDTAKALSRIQRRKLERAQAHAKWEIEELTRKHAEIQQRLVRLQNPSS